MIAYSDSPIYSGAEQVWVEVVSRLAREPGFAMSVAAPHENLQLMDALSHATDATVTDVPAHVGAFAQLRQRRTLLDLTPFDVVVVNLPSPEFANRVLLDAKRADTTLIGLLHIHHSLGAAGFRLGRARDLVARRALKCLDRTLVVSPRGLDGAARTWRLDRQTVSRLPLTWPTVSLTPRGEARAALGLSADDLVVLLPGRLTPKQKGQDLALEALSRIPADRRPRLLIAGSGDQAPLRELAARLRVERSVTWCDARPIGLLFGAADGIVLPSRFEGLPLVALEALACGLNGVASDVDGLGAVWPAQWRFPHGDLDALTALLTTWVVDPPGREDGFTAAREAAEAQCGCAGDAVVSQLLSV